MANKRTLFVPHSYSCCVNAISSKCFLNNIEYLYNFFARNNNSYERKCVFISTRKLISEWIMCEGHEKTARKPQNAILILEDFKIYLIYNRALDHTRATLRFIIPIQDTFVYCTVSGCHKDHIECVGSFYMIGIHFFSSPPPISLPFILRFIFNSNRIIYVGLRSKSTYKHRAVMKLFCEIILFSWFYGIMRA